GWILKVGLPLALVLICGELIPKYLGLIHNEQLAIHFAPYVEWLEWIITPFRVVITNVAPFLSRLLFFFFNPEPPLSKEELQHILESSEGKGLLHRDEAELIYGVLYLEEKQVNELMRPRSEMLIYDIEEPLSKLIHLFSEQRVSEVAVFEMPEEKILGAIRARDFFINRAQIQSGNDLMKIWRKPFFVPETTSAKSLLEQLHQHDVPCAWVVDEYGATCGMITEQDLLSHVVASTHKQATEKQEYTRV